MKNFKKTKTASAAALMLAIMLTASACGVNENNSPQNGNDSAQAGVNEQLPEGSGIQDPGSLGSDDESNKPEESAATGGDITTDTDEPAAVILSNEGTYTGQIDSNSIEIKTAEGAAAYRVTEELAPVIESLPSDAAVTFEYTEKVIDSEQGIKQLWLTKIETK
ncbi:hypothetical protein ACX1C1_26370 [Paenibacillus sp. strain BS8-2]